MAMSRQKKLDKMELIELQSEKPKPSFEFKNARTPWTLYLPNQGSSDWLWPSVDQAFEPNLWTQSKVAIIGANGIGKTTLLKSLLGIIPPIAGGEVERGDYLELGYFEQEVEGGNRRTPLEAVWNAFPALNQAKFVPLLPVVVWPPNISRAKFRCYPVGSKPRYASVSWWIVKTMSWYWTSRPTTWMWMPKMNWNGLWKSTRDRFSWFATSQISMKAGWTKSGTLMNWRKDKENRMVLFSD